MRTEFRLAEHTEKPGTTVVEIWYGDKFIAQITSADFGPHVRIISKHPIHAVVRPDAGIMQQMLGASFVDVRIRV